MIVVTGCGGLVGSEAALYFAGRGAVVGIDNDMRALFFGTSVAGRIAELRSALGERLEYHDWDIRDGVAIRHLFEKYGDEIEIVIHAAAQPSHDYAAQNPVRDFEINALGTLNLLEATYHHAPDAVFIFCSTNKVYGDRPNSLALAEGLTRYEPADTAFWNGINEQMSVDKCAHSLFGASKLAADVMVQEYGRYFGLKTVCFRAGCLTGPHHAGAEQHGFLSYLMKCVTEGRPYTVYGYRGKQVRDNLHAHDLARAFEAFAQNPRRGAVYNIGGGRENSVSVLEAIDLCEKVAGRKLDYQISEAARVGDHKWWITDNWKFRRDYDWRPEIGLERILSEMVGVPA
jgi:CDP-paratose 2-epimerase